MALKATRTTGPLAPPSMDYSDAALRLQLSCGLNFAAGSLIVRVQLSCGFKCAARWRRTSCAPGPAILHRCKLRSRDEGPALLLSRRAAAGARNPCGPPRAPAILPAELRRNKVARALCPRAWEKFRPWATWKFRR